MQEYRIGIDIGGTHISAGLLDSSGAVVRSSRTDFPRGASGGELADAVFSLAQDTLHGAGECRAISVGAAAPGCVSPDGELLLDAHNLGYDELPLRALLSERFGLPVSIVNDADAAALAEARLGALSGCDTAVLLTLGTGLGCGLILGGELFRGGRGSGTEAGHMILAQGGERCTCGNRGCAECYASATALARMGRLAMPQEDPCAIDARRIVTLARAGDAGAQRVFEEYIGCLGSVVASIINLLDPQRIALGGGLSAAGDMLFLPLGEDVDKKCFFRTRGDIVPARFGNDAGFIGAALL